MSRERRRPKRPKARPEAVVAAPAPAPGSGSAGAGTRSEEEPPSHGALLDRPWLPPLVLALVVAAAYGNALLGGFALDSKVILLESPQLTAFTWENLRLVLGRDYWWPGLVSGAYRPFTTLSYAVEYSLLGFGREPFGYLAVNLLLHWANAILVLTLLKRALGLETRVALLASALFAAHPIGSEVVANVVGRADLLAGAAVLGALVLHERLGRASGRERYPLLLALYAALLLGPLCKENAIVAAALLVAYDLLYRSPFRRDGDRALAARRLAAVAIRRWLPLFAPAAAVLALRAWVYADEAVVPPNYAFNTAVGLDLVASRLTALKILARSLGVVLWPATLCPDYSVAEVLPFGSDPLDAPRALAAVLAPTAAVAFAMRAAWRGHRFGKPLLFLSAFAFVTWLPTSNLLFLIGSTMAERFLYLPQVGVLATLVLWAEMAALGGARRLRPGRAAELAAAVSSALVVVGTIALALRAHERNADWRDDLTLWGAAAEACPASYHSLHGLAAAIASEDTPDRESSDRAIALAEEAQAILVRTAPAGAEVPLHVLEFLGALYFGRAEIEERGEGRSEAVAAGRGDAWRRKAIAALEPVDAWYRATNASLAAQRSGSGGFFVGRRAVYEQLGAARLALGEHQLAHDAFAQLRLLAPGDPAAYLGTAEVLLAEGKREDALVALVQASLVGPGNEDVARRLLALDREIHPGGCLLGESDGRAVWRDDCPRGQALLCRAYEGLAAAFRAAPRLTAEQRAEALSSLRSLARDDGCAASDERAGVESERAQRR